MANAMVLGPGLLEIKEITMKNFSIYAVIAICLLLTTACTTPLKSQSSPGENAKEQPRRLPSNRHLYDRVYPR